MPAKCTEGHDYRRVGRFKIRAGWVIKYKCRNCGHEYTERE